MAEGDVYHKTITVPSKATVVGLFVVGVLLIYVGLCVGGVVPSQYNIVDYIMPQNTSVGNENNTSNNTENNNTSNGTMVSSAPQVLVWGLPDTLNLSQQPHTSWQVTFKVTKGTVENLAFRINVAGLHNVSISMASSYSNWEIDSNSAIYHGTLSEGAFVTISINIDAESGYSVEPVSYISIEPTVVGVVFHGDLMTHISS